MQPGTRVGQYDIVAPIGAGGMGIVYRARDSRPGRDVAVKMLPGIFAGDSDRLARFEREARAAMPVGEAQCARSVVPARLPATARRDPRGHSGEVTT